MLREVFLRVLRFSPLLKNQHFQIPIQSRFHWTNSHSVEVPLKIPIITIIIIITKVGLLPPTCTWIRSLMATFCKEPVPSCFPIIFTCNKDLKRSNLQPVGNKLKKKKNVNKKQFFHNLFKRVQMIDSLAYIIHDRIFLAFVLLNDSFTIIVVNVATTKKQY